MGAVDPSLALRIACWNGDLPAVQRLLAEGVPIEGQGDKLARTPLFMACHGGSVDIIRFLLQHGAHADVVDSHGDTTIGQACEYGKLEAAKLMLAAGADVTRVNNWGRTPLMLAAREGRDDVVAWLISQHVDVNYHATNLPALYYAVDGDHLAIAQMLIEAGAKPDVAPAPVAGNDHPFNYLSLAAKDDDPKMLALVLAHGATIDQRDEWGRTALMRAAMESKLHAIGFLLDHGADINATDEDGCTPLIFSSYFSAPSSPGVTQVLVQRGAHLEARNKDGRTALIIAGMHVDDDEAHTLIDLGADINATDVKGETALAYAGDRGDMPLVAYLAGKGAKQTDVHILPKLAANPPLAAAQSWALALGAIYVQRNGTNPHVLGYDANADDPGEAKRELKRDWNITNQAQLLLQLDQLKDPGDRTPVQKLGAQLVLLTDADFEERLREKITDPKKAAVFRAVRQNYLKWKDCSGLAFDLARRAHMICMGYDAGYITSDQAWPLLLENARLAQAGFQSWQEFGDNFLDARGVAAGESDPLFENCTHLLQNPKDPNSPWNQLPWNMDLGKS